MPSGITAPIYEGKQGFTFEEFVWRSARQFGALIHMREESLDAPIQERSTFGTYHVDQLKAANARLAELKKMPLEQAAALEREARKKRVREARETEAKRLAMATRFEVMLAKVQAWTPPTEEHEPLRNFMVEQIRDSLKMDCAPLPESFLNPQTRTPEQWIADEVAHAERDIAYHTKELAEDEKRDDWREKWIRALAKSVPIPKSLRP